MIDLEQLKRDRDAGTPGPWTGHNMVHADGRPMTPEEIGEYVCNSVKMGEAGRFLFVGGKHEDGGDCDICHTGNGPRGFANTARIARVPDLEAMVLEQADELTRLRAELDTMKTAGIIEVAVRNPNVSDYMAHWEGRALKAEAEAELAEEQRISTERGNHIEFELLPQMADLTMRVKELEAELAAAREQVAGMGEVLRSKMTGSWDLGYEHGKVLACDTPTVCRDREVEMAMSTDAAAALEARDARVRAEERAKVIGEACAAIVHQARTTLNGVSESEAGICANIVRALHTEASRGAAE